MDISEEAGWAGEPENFIQALLDIKWLDNTSRGLKLHDWEQHQPFIATHSKRSKQARKAAEIRWEKEKQKQGDTCGQHESALLNDEKRYAPYPSPSPLPSPSPKKKEYITPLLGEHKNVKVTEKELESLKEYVGSKERALDLIERLSIYIKSSGKRYANHYATMQGWHRKDYKSGNSDTNLLDAAGHELEII
jgi:hypothetical protein